MDEKRVALRRSSGHSSEVRSIPSTPAPASLTNLARRSILLGLMGFGLTFLSACDCGSAGSVEPHPEVPAVPEETPTPTLRILVITDLQGTLAPCGCNARPLGGIDRMVAALEREAGDVPHVFVAAGELLAGGPTHAVADGAQTTRWKAEAALAALMEAGLAAAPGGEADRNTPGVTELETPDLALYRAPNALHSLTIGGTKVNFLSVEEGVTEAALAERVQEVRMPDSAGPSLVVLLASGSRRSMRGFAVPGVDFVIQGDLDLADPLPPASSGDGWLIHAGRQGQGFVVIDVFWSGSSDQGDWIGGPMTNVSEWNIEVERERLAQEIAELQAQLTEWRDEGQTAEALAPQDARLRRMESERDALAVSSARDHASFAARLIELDPDEPRDPEVQAQLRHLDRQINGHNQEVFADREPPPVADGGPSYVGSTTCGTCHADAFSWWSGHAHGRAYATLQALDKEFHLDCVGCHVTGYERPGGSTVTHNLDGALTSVGCENCHGPGSQHIAAPSEFALASSPNERVCLGCHTEEHSDHFDFAVYRPRLLAPGHGLPAAEQR